MKLARFVLAAVALAIAAPVAAQDSPNTIEGLLKAIRLPQETQEARILGVPERDIRTILTTGREQRVPAGVLTEVLVVENESIREHGPVDNFGAFVQAQLQQGKRGRDLAAAIRAEHAARGKGKGAIRGHGGASPVNPSEGASDGAKGRSGERRPDAPGNQAEKAKPNEAGKSGDAPGKGGKGGS